MCSYGTELAVTVVSFNEPESMQMIVETILQQVSAIKISLQETVVSIKASLVKLNLFLLEVELRYYFQCL